MLVHPALPADLPQLPDEIDRRPTILHDVPVVPLRRPLWNLRHSAAVQHPFDSAAAVFLCALRRQLGTVHGLRSVSWS